MEPTENKTNKPRDNVLTPDQKPSYPVGITIAVVFLAINFLVAAFYFGILKL